MRRGRIITRRDFLRGATYGAAGLACGMSLVSSSRGQETGKTNGRTARVVLVRHPKAVDQQGQLNDEVIARMLDDAVCALTGHEKEGSAWQSLLAPDDVLGIKSNVWGYLPTPPGLEAALTERALQVGIPEQDIAIDDRGVLDDPVFKRSTALVNVRPLRTHHWSGIGGCLKNYIMFVRRPHLWHDDSCADLGGLWNLPICRGKTRLNILVALTPLFHGIGPHHFDPQHVWPYRGLLVSTDPVAVDALGVKLLAEQRRRFFERPPRGGTSAKHVALAETRHEVGVADLERIEIIRLGWQEGSLI